MLTNKQKFAKFASAWRNRYKLLIFIVLSEKTAEEKSAAVGGKSGLIDCNPLLRAECSMKNGDYLWESLTVPALSK